MAVGEKQLMDWRKLFSAAADQSLTFHSPQKSEGKVFIFLPNEVYEEGKKLWENAVVA